MTTLFILDVPENKPVAEVAGRDPELGIERVGPYFKLTSAGTIVIDRRATGCRHAVWYSSVAGLTDSVIVQWDKDAMKVEPR
ncbi:hypothetical protein ACFWF3_25160 [Nocardia sp. NPDC060220]|uniref:hypothetical protein n=1 Tax=Nocardia sp. NPDC060220 TaxID=3347076 RepID=UPI00365E0769